MKNKLSEKLLNLKLSENQSITARYQIQKLQQQIDDKLGIKSMQSKSE